MYIYQAKRRNATKHKVRCLMAMKKSFKTQSYEYKYLNSRIKFLEIKLRDSTYTL